MGVGTNETSVYSGTFSDTSAHHLPDTDTADTEGYDIRTADKATVVIVNNQDQDATVQLRGAAFDDPEMNEAVEIGSSVTASASGGTAYVSVPIEDQFAFLDVEVSFATAPTGSASIEAKFHSDRMG